MQPNLLSISKRMHASRPINIWLYVYCHSTCPLIDLGHNIKFFILALGVFNKIVNLDIYSHGRS